jgi:hypothetical protein
MTDNQNNSMHATSEEIEEYEQETGEIHPIFSVDHRPERISFELDDQEEKEAEK